MRSVLVLAALFAVALPLQATTRIRIDSVSPEYTPTAGVKLPEPVSMEDFHFEVNKEKTRVRIVVDYTYPDEKVFQDEGGLGPSSTFAQVPGLKYDAAAHAIVYEANGKSIVCAKVKERTTRSGATKFKITNSGTCTVEASVADHKEDDGWTTQRTRSLDTFFILP